MDTTGVQEAGVTAAAPRRSHLSHPYRLCHEVSATGPVRRVLPVDQHTMAGFAPPYNGITEGVVCWLVDHDRLAPGASPLGLRRCRSDGHSFAGSSKDAEDLRR
jgi:hypothetical protein